LRDAKVRTLLSVAAFGFLFLSAVLNKLPHYVLPLVPSLCVLMALGVLKQRRPFLALILPVTLLGLLPVASQVLPGALAHGIRSSAVSFGPALVWVPVAGLAGVAIAFGLRRHSLAFAPAAAALAFTWLHWTLYPVLDRAVSLRSVWMATQPGCLDSTNRSREYGLQYYAARKLPPCKALDPGVPTGVR
jgi:4-amino-4-deoxy-L-arabinose transferase-like glycosyltransferase